MYEGKRGLPPLKVQPHRARFGTLKATRSLRSTQRRVRKGLVSSNISAAPREARGREISSMRLLIL
jgi:hypothetical protein